MKSFSAFSAENSAFSAVKKEELTAENAKVAQSPQRLLINQKAEDNPKGNVTMSGLEIRRFLPFFSV
jgi:hypothetical protein